MVEQFHSHAEDDRQASERLLERVVGRLEALHLEAMGRLDGLEAALQSRFDELGRQVGTRFDEFGRQLEEVRSRAGTPRSSGTCLTPRTRSGHTSPLYSPARTSPPSIC